MDMMPTSPKTAETTETIRAEPRERNGAGKRGRPSNTERLKNAFGKKKPDAKSAKKAPPKAGPDGEAQFTPPGDEAFEPPKGAAREKAKPRGKKSVDPDSIKMFANVLGGVYLTLAGLTQTPEWMLSEPEAIDYATDICTALSYFEFELDPKMMAVSAAMMKSIKVNAPRLQATAMRAKMRRQQAAQAGGAQPGGYTRQGPPRPAQNGQNGPNGGFGPGMDDMGASSPTRSPNGPQGPGGPGMGELGPDPAEIARAAMYVQEPTPPQTTLYGAPSAFDGPGVPD